MPYQRPSRLKNWRIKVAVILGLLVLDLYLALVQLPYERYLILQVNAPVHELDMNREKFENESFGKEIFRRLKNSSCDWLFSCKASSSQKVVR